MKRILLVLALLAIVSVGFSVSGSMYMRYNSDGSVTATEWGMLDDLRVGRRGTGFDLNFDSFTLSYKLRSPLTLQNNWQIDGSGSAVVSAYTSGSAPVISSPGYVQLTGLKLGGMDLGVGVTVWTFGETGKKFETNNAFTNTDVTGSASYNLLGVDFQMSLPLGDSMRLHIDPWDKADLYLGGGSADVAGLGVTNKGTSSYMKLVLPVHLDYSADVLSLEIFPKITVMSDAEKNTTINTTNDFAKASLILGGMVRVGYVINEFASAYAHIGFVSGTDGSIEYKNNGETNITAHVYSDLPIFAGVCLKPAGPVNLNLGIGYLMKLSDTTAKVSGVGGVGTNVTTKGGGLQSEYGYFDEHGYKNPLLRFAGSAKFATDWEFGMSTIVYAWAGAGAGTGNDANYYVNTTSVANSGVGGFTQQSQILHFNYFNNWDGGGNGFGACYIQYSKDNVTFRGKLGDGTGLAGLFGFVDASFAF